MACFPAAFVFAVSNCRKIRGLYLFKKLVWWVYFRGRIFTKGLGGGAYYRKDICSSPSTNKYPGRRLSGLTHCLGCRRTKS